MVKLELPKVLSIVIPVIRRFELVMLFEIRLELVRDVIKLLDIIEFEIVVFVVILFEIVEFVVMIEAVVIWLELTVDKIVIPGTFKLLVVVFWCNELVNERLVVVMLVVIKLVVSKFGMVDEFVNIAVEVIMFEVVILVVKILVVVLFVEIKLFMEAVDNIEFEFMNKLLLVILVVTKLVDRRVGENKDVMVEFVAIKLPVVILMET